MMLLFIVLNIFTVLVYISSACVKTPEDEIKSGNNTNEDEARQFLEEYSNEAVKVLNKQMIALWNYQTNLTNENKEEYVKASELGSDFSEENSQKATTFAWKNFKHTNETAYDFFKAIARFSGVLSDEKRKELDDAISDMIQIHSTARVCIYSGDTCTQQVLPDQIMQSSRNYDELESAWVQFRNIVGRQTKQSFLKYVELSNEEACLNGFSDAGDEWRVEFEDDETIFQEFHQLWLDIKPFYEQLHAYVRRKLMALYPGHIKEDGPIPAHILGDMMAGSWGNIYDLVLPYPDKEARKVDATVIMQQKGVTVLDMVKKAEEFFISLGLKEMPPSFYKLSIFEQPPDRQIVCHPSTFYFYIDDDIRLKMCSSVNVEDFIILHHEMGHAEYFLQYRDQPFMYREGANSGFHEAIGDLIGLSAYTESHLVEIGYLEETNDDFETDINDLMKRGLNKLATLPYTYLVDLWRWRVFDGSIDTNSLNTQWWNHRLNYQGVCPPVPRTEDDLDALALYHIGAGIPFIRYFISYIIQFQFHKALCEEAGYTGPLYKCNVYGNKAAGKLLGDMLKLGSSVPWREAMKVITKGKSDKMDASAILEYYSLLHEWLKEQNKNEFVGWRSNNSMQCP